MKKILFYAAFIFLSSAAVTFVAFGQYQVTRSINLPGDGFWDYLTVDETNAKVFASHLSQVQVVDLKTGTLVGTIEDTKGVHGIALAPELNKGFTSNGQESSVTVFDLTTLKTIVKIKVTGINPDAILYDSFSKRIFTGNGGSASFSVIDAVNEKEISTIPLDGKPEAIVSDGNGKIYVNIEDKSCINVIDAITLKVIAHWPISPGEDPTGLAMDLENQLLFSACDNEIMVVTDAATGKVVSTFPIGEGCDGAAFDQGSKRIFASNGEGTLTVAQETSRGIFNVVETVPTRRGARTIALDKSTHYIYLPTADFLEVPAGGNGRPSIKPGSFTILEVAPLK